MLHLVFKKTSKVSRQFLRNGVVAGVSLIVDYGVYWLLVSAHGITVALIVGYLSGLVINFALSSAWVFNERRFSKLSKLFFVFTLGALSGLAVELAVITIAKQIFSPFIARAISLFVAFFWNFFIKKEFVYRRRRAISLATILGSFQHLSFSEKLYITIRYLTCPIEQVASELPDSGSVLEIGCGSGILLAAIHAAKPNLQLSGCDIDPKKLSTTQKLDFPVNVSNHEPKPNSKKFNAVCIVDVLYLMPSARVEQIIEQSLALLKPDGTLIIKEMSARPRWKNRWNKFQEYISNLLSKMPTVQHDEQSFITTEQIKKLLVDRGLSVTQMRIDKNFLHPYTLLISRREHARKQKTYSDTD